MHCNVVVNIDLNVCCAVQVLIRILTKQGYGIIEHCFQQIKKNEVKPATDYLFNNSFTNNAKNLENTIAKLDKMSQLGYIPRNT